MSTTTLVVVGDRFSEFLGNRGTISASSLLLRLRSARTGRTTGITPAQVQVGQGLTTDQRDELALLLGRAPGADGTDAVPTVAGRRLTHKHDPKNAMIGHPTQLARDSFVADLIIDERTETLEDHLTGQHIPAIALTEAARQMWTAVTEEFLLERDGQAKRFVVISIASTFRSYVFPLPATVAFELLDRARTGAGEAFTCRIEVRQGTGVAVEIRGEYRVVPEAVSNKQESMAARRALAAATGAAAVAVAPKPA